MASASSLPTLLIVDDDPGIVRLVESVATKRFGDQLQIEAHTDPKVTLKRIDEGSVELLITDIDMPHIDGIRLLREAKTRNPVTQVIVLTGCSTNESLLAAAEGGAIDYLHKPIDKHDLLDQISQAIERNQRWRNALAVSWRQRRENAVAE